MLKILDPYKYAYYDHNESIESTSSLIYNQAAILKVFSQTIGRKFINFFWYGLRGASLALWVAHKLREGVESSRLKSLSQPVAFTDDCNSSILQQHWKESTRESLAFLHNFDNSNFIVRRVWWHSPL